MIKKHNDRLLIVLAAGVIVLLAAACVLLFSDCGNDSWISSGGSQSEHDSSFISSEQSSGLDGVYAAPTFKNGSYLLLTTTSTTEDYTDGSGKVMYSYTSTTKYTYQLDIALTDSGLVCKYTFVNIYGAINDNGTLKIDINTTDPSNYSESVAHFYDLLGQSFIITADKNGRVTSISGLDSIIAAYPDTAALLDEATLLGMAGDLFYAQPAAYSAGTSWTVNSYGLDNTYTVSKLSSGRFGIDIAGADYTLPDPTTDASGYTTTYTSCSPITGTLWIDQNDRALQELSTRQRTDGVISDADGYGMYFSITTTTSSAITAAGE